MYVTHNPQSYRMYDVSSTPSFSKEMTELKQNELLHDFPRDEGVCVGRGGLCCRVTVSVHFLIARWGVWKEMEKMLGCSEMLRIYFYCDSF